MTTPTLAVTGATGAIGGAVAHTLAEAGLAQRLLVRDPSRAPRLAAAEVAAIDYADPVALAASLEGVRTLFLVSATEAPDRLALHRSVIDAAAEAGVTHLVYTSFAGASPTATFTFARDHAATEEMIRASGIGHTLLRDNFYLDVLPHFADEAGVISGPAGEGRVAAVARADVAAVAATVLRDPQRHLGQTYELTGPQALTLAEVAAIITEVTGRPTRFHDETVPEAYASRRRWPAEQWQYDAWVSTYTAIAAGELARVTDDVERVTGRPPTDLATLLRG